jgi:hypothetical protein
MSVEGEDPPIRKPGIELEPLGIKGGDVAPSRDNELEDYILAKQTSPIPSNPLHQCPNCDYLLTGLTSRRCPECGQSFELHDARMHAIDRSIFGSGFFNSPWFEQAKVAFGGLMIGVGFSLPCFFFAKRGSAHSVIMAVMLPAILALGTLYKASRDLTWAQALILMGSVTLCLGLILSFT